MIASIATAPSRARVGIDLVEVSEVASSVAQFGERYTSRVFTERELRSCGASPGAAVAGVTARLAERFAAKEATVKVLQPGDSEVNWRSVEVRCGPDGRYQLHLSGNAARLAREAGITSMVVSVSHGAGLAMAVVVAFCEPARQGQLSAPASP
jgi:holo-[acyl-carrier protein] synthase